MVSDNDCLIVLGFGGHARSIADVALSIGYKSLLFIDENARVGETFLGFSVVKEMPSDISYNWPYISAIGDNYKRRKQIELINPTSRQLTTIIAKTATIGAGAKVSSGCFVGHHAHIGPMATIGQGSIINTSAVVEHDCQIAEYAHISVNATVAGKCVIGSSSFIGAAATVIDSINITSDVTVGAGAVVIQDIVYPGIYVGTPARLLSR